MPKALPGVSAGGGAGAARPGSAGCVCQADPCAKANPGQPAVVQQPRNGPGPQQREAAVTHPSAKPERSGPPGAATRGCTQLGQPLRRRHLPSRSLGGGPDPWPCPRCRGCGRRLRAALADPGPARPPRAARPRPYRDSAGSGGRARATCSAGS